MFGKLTRQSAKPQVGQYYKAICDLGKRNFRQLQPAYQIRLVLLLMGNQQPMQRGVQIELQVQNLETGDLV